MIKLTHNQMFAIKYWYYAYSKDKKIEHCPFDTIRYLDMRTNRYEDKRDLVNCLVCGKIFNYDPFYDKIYIPTCPCALFSFDVVVDNVEKIFKGSNYCKFKDGEVSGDIADIGILTSFTALYYKNTNVKKGFFKKIFVRLEEMQRKLADVSYQDIFWVF